MRPFGRGGPAAIRPGGGRSVKPRPYIGGQAIIEGVFMRAPRAVAMAARAPDGRILTEVRPYRPITDRLPALGWPFVRGAVVMVESLVLGMKALSWSAEVAGAGEAEEGGETTRETSRGDQLAIAGSLGFAILAGLAFFVALPHLLTAGLGRWAGWGLDADQPAFHLVDGLFKVVLFVGYLAVIGRMEDIRRVFAYHGAEHMTIYAWEAGRPLTPDEVARWSRFHPRCGTSFLLFVILASIAVFTPVFALLPPLPVQGAVLRNLAQVAIKLPLMLPVAALAYELIRLSARYYRVPVLRAFVLPGMWLQRLTTRPPDREQLEVAIASLEAAWACHAEQDADDLGIEGAAFLTGQAAAGSPG